MHQPGREPGVPAEPGALLQLGPGARGSPGGRTSIGLRCFVRSRKWPIQNLSIVLHLEPHGSSSEAELNLWVRCRSPGAAESRTRPGRGTRGSRGARSERSHRLGPGTRGSQGGEESRSEKMLQPDREQKNASTGLPPPTRNQPYLHHHLHRHPSHLHPLPPSHV